MSVGQPTLEIYTKISLFFQMAAHQVQQFYSGDFSQWLPCLNVFKSCIFPLILFHVLLRFLWCIILLVHVHSMICDGVYVSIRRYKLTPPWLTKTLSCNMGERKIKYHYTLDMPFMLDGIREKEAVLWFCI